LIRRGQASSAIHANMTPMIDVIFLLIVFFVAVSQIVDRDAVLLELPVINNSAASDIGNDEKVIVNLIGNVDGQVSEIQVGRHHVFIDDVETLNRIVSTRLNGGASEIHIRAERTVAYQYVYEVFESIQLIDSSLHIQLVVKDDEG